VLTPQRLSDDIGIAMVLMETGRTGTGERRA